MIRFIEGTVASVSTSGVVILVGGLGYRVHTTKKTTLLPHDSVSLHTYLAVRETALDLYGFVSQIELDLFELLLTLPKIGPKSALQILDQADVSVIIESIHTQDPEHLNKLSGISKKTAEKIVSALKDKIDHFITNNPIIITRADTQYQDAFDTLVTLGYNPIHIKRVLDSMKSTDTTSIMVKIALRSLS
jgi:Holliday junction DNA helicase RuvA